jgi:hypothetical protein
MVCARVSAHTVTVYADHERVATHDRRGPGYRTTVEGHLPDHRADVRHRSRAFWEQCADGLGDEVGHYVRAICDSDDVLSQLRAVQAIVTHLEWTVRSGLGIIAWPSLRDSIRRLRS